MATDITNNYSNVVSGTSTSGSSLASSAQSLGKEDFLKILVAQLKNQDPLEPMKGTDFTAQLAQFSSLEQLRNLNDTLETQSVNQMTLGYTQAVGMIGKTAVTSLGNTIIANGESAEINYSLASDAQTVTISIRDSEGNVVKTWDETGKTAGRNSTTWNCSGVEEGEYTYQITANTTTGESVNVETMTTGIVTAVHFKDNKISVTLNGKEVALSDITEIKNPDNG